MALHAIIFDVDGTLVDSNPAHVQAWLESTRHAGYEISRDRIEAEIGKGGDKLVPSIFGRDIERTSGEKLRKAQAAGYEKIVGSTSLQLFAGTTALLAALRQRGLKLALATSSKPRALKATGRSAGINWADHFDAVVTAEDATESKPSPAILQAAIAKLGLAPTECAMIGDTPYDAQAARDAGVVCLGVTCGGMNGREALRAAGMRAVFRDPSDLGSHLDEALSIASPGSHIHTHELSLSLMREALKVAREGMERGEVPIGCVLARNDGTIVARGCNELNATHDLTAHAEMVAFRRAAGKVPPDTRDLILASTLEPCVMCLGAAMQVAVDTIVFGLNAPADGGRARVRPPISPGSQMPRILRDILACESRGLLEEFLRGSPENPAQATFVRQLLGMT